MCVSKLTIIDSDSGLSPGWHQAIIWTNAGMLLIGPSGTNFSEMLIEIQYIFIQENVFANVVRKMVAILYQPQCFKWNRRLGAVSIWRWCLTSIGIPMLKIRRSLDCLIPNMGIPIPGKNGLYIETGTWLLVFGLGSFVWCSLCPKCYFITLSLHRNWCQFADFFKCIFRIQNYCILIKISLEFTLKGPIENKSALLWVMAWHQTGNKPLSEPLVA